MKKISHWIVMTGEPIMTGITRKSARKCIKEEKFLKFWQGTTEQFKYIGKVIPDEKRKGHGKIVLEY